MSLEGGGASGPGSPRADLVAAAVLAAFGLAVVALAWRMPTFAEQSGTGLTAPGIEPGFHGLVLVALSLLLGLRAWRRGALAAQPRRAGGDAAALAIAAVLGIIYAGGLVGRLPFWLATALFVFAFTAAFEWPLGPAGRTRRLAEAAAIALATAVIVSLVFEKLFLVRLP